MRYRYLATTSGLPADHPLWDMENVIITPHIAGYALPVAVHRRPEAQRCLIADPRAESDAAWAQNAAAKAEIARTEAATRHEEELRKEWYSRITAIGASSSSTRFGHIPIQHSLPLVAFGDLDCFVTGPADDLG